MSYSRYFGMRSFENIIRDARFRVPRTGTPLKIGSPVVLDGAAAGFMKQAAAGAAPGPAAGVVIYEHIQYRGSTDSTLQGYSDPPFDQVPLGQYAQIVHGPGAKFWFKVVGDKVLYDGRTQTGGSLLQAGLDLTTLTPGSTLAPVAGGLFGPAGTNPAWLTVEQCNPTTGLVEARLSF